MRSLPVLLCVALALAPALGCSGPKVPEGPAPTSQFAEANLVFGPAPDPTKPEVRPGRLTCTVGLIPAYKHKDAADLALWIFPRESASGLNDSCDFANPALHGQRAPIISQSFTGEGVLLHFSAIWPGGPQNQILALDVSRHGRRIARIFGTMQP
ncbi:MAG: hypothetical protein JST24_00310 [Acidobacteria bacterium]|nr:hypothetical protein [Acidobacteriota bacterium]